MCGIAGIHVKAAGFYGDDDLKIMARALLLGIEERGKDATGFAMLGYKDGEAVVVARKRPVRAAKFIDNGYVDWVCQPKTLILHTRLATQGPHHVNVNNHPMMHNTCFVVHNGMISNDYELFYDKRIERNCATDSAIIPVVLNERPWDEASEALAELEGNFAIAAIDPVKYPGALLLGRNRWSPLVVYQTANILVWASTVNAIKFAWEQAFGNKARDNKFYEFKEDEVWFIPEFGEVRRQEIPFVPTAGWQHGGSTCGWTPRRGSTNSTESTDSGISTSRVPLFTHEDGGHEYRWWMYGNTLYADVRAVTDGRHVDGVVARYDDGDVQYCKDTGVDTFLLYYDKKSFVCRDVYNMNDEREPVISAEHETLLLDFLSDDALIYGSGDDEDVVACVARDMDMSPEYINWLLVSAPQSAMETNARLAAVFAEADRLYAEYDAAHRMTV